MEFPLFKMMIQIFSLLFPTEDKSYDAIIKIPDPPKDLLKKPYKFYFFTKPNKFLYFLNLSREIQVTKRQQMFFFKRKKHQNFTKK